MSTSIRHRPAFRWVAVALELFTAVGAIPAGVLLVLDPTGGLIQLPSRWIEPTVFGSYALPGLYLLLVNGIAMVVAAVLAVRDHPLAPWLTGVLGVGLIAWIVVEIVVLPETMVLTWVFLAIGLGLGLVAAIWLVAATRRTGGLQR